MAAIDRATLQSGYNQAGAGAFPDNTSRDISPADLRSFVDAIVQSSRNIVDDSYIQYTATASGTNTYTASLSPPITAYAANHIYWILFTNANTGACTLNLNGVGVKSIVKKGATALVSGDIATGQIYGLAYDGSNMQIVSSFGGATGLTGSLTSPRVPFASGSSTLVDDSNFQYDSTTKKLTLGAAAVSALLEVFKSTGLSAKYDANGIQGLYNAASSGSAYAINGANGTGSLLTGQSIQINGGTPSGAGNGGSINITPGVAGGGGVNGNLGFFNGVAGSPRATTSGSASTFAANTSGTLNDSATWDGYTIGQVVKALRNYGLLT